MVKVVSNRKGEFNHGLTRNLGVRIARGKYVCFLSQDISLINDQFIHRFTHYLDEIPRAMAIFGKQYPYHNASAIEKLNNRLFYSALGQYSNKEGVVIQDINNKFAPLNSKNNLLWYSLSNVFACYKRSFLLKNPFPETNYGEDILIGKRIIEKKLIKIYDSKSVCYHSHNLSLREFMKRQLLELRLKNNLNIPRNRMSLKIIYILHQKWGLFKKLNILRAIGCDYLIKLPLFLIYRVSAYLAG